MKLHEDKVLFAEIILRASQPKENSGLGINAGFVEKDYWITKTLHQLSRSSAKKYAVFKGGTSLSKIYHIGSRFSEDVDVVIVKPEGMRDAKIKSIIRSTEKYRQELPTLAYSTIPLVTEIESVMKYVFERINRIER